MNKLSRFAVVGGCIALLDYGIYATLSKVWGWPKFGAYALAIAVSCPLSFIGQRDWAFRVRRELTPQAVEFLAVILSNAIVIEPLVLYLIPDVLTARLSSMCVGAAWNFFWFDRRVFAIGRKGNTSC